MRELRKPVSAGLAGLVFLIVAACGGSSPASGAAGTGCVNGSAPNKAYLVVQHQAGGSLQKCVGFSAAQIAGDELMKDSGVKFATQHFSFGDAVCAIDNEPPSFDSCLPQGAPYWALWVAAQGGAWQQAQAGFTAVKLGPGDALGWRYTPQSETNPSPPPPAKK
jgi:hypothetical protein